MRILQACPYSWDSHGGVQAHVRNLADHLERRGHEVMILAPGRPRPVNGPLRIVGRPFHVRFNGSRTSVCVSTRSLLRIRRIVQAFKPDVVHAHEPLCPGVSMAATMLARVPVVGTYHAHYDPSICSALYTAEAWLMSRVWRRVDLGLAVSKAAAECIESRIETTVRVIPNGIDTSRFSKVPPNGKPASRRVLFVGRLDKRKGFPVVVQAFAALAERFPDLLLVVVGDGPDRAFVERLRPDLRARVVMRGKCRDADLVADYASAAVFIAPALGSESFGVVLLEAMSAGLPVVASDIAGYREVARDGTEAILVPPGDVRALSEAVGRILVDPDLAHSLGERGRSRARQFSWETVAASIEGVYEEGLSIKGAEPVRLLV
ncbi:MAG: glycosyltransferase family 4 protein [Vicinamibacterales bacterium]